MQNIREREVKGNIKKQQKSFRCKRTVCMWRLQMNLSFHRIFSHQGCHLVGTDPTPLQHLLESLLCFLGPV
jgi:hypothetical protein